MRPGLYRHYKGNLYRVYLTATNSETNERMVVYQSLYGTFDFWTRPEKMFDETIHLNGKVFKRFEFIENLD